MDWQMTANYRWSARNPKRAPVFGNTVYKWLKTLWLKTGRKTSWPQLLLLGPGKANRNVFTLDASTWKNSNADGRNQTLIIKHFSLKKKKKEKRIGDKYHKAVKGLELGATANGEKLRKCLQGALALSLSLYIKFVNTFQKHTEYINTCYCSVS